MTIALRGTPSRQSIAAQTGGLPRDIVVNAPTGLASGDYLIFVIFWENNAGNTLFPTVTAPSGWTQLDKDALGGYSGLEIWAKQAGSSEPSTYTFQAAATPALFANSSDCSLIAYASANLVGTAGIQLNTSNSNNVQCPSVGGATAGDKLFCVFAGGNGGTQGPGITQPGSMTQVTRKPGTDWNAYTTAHEDLVSTGATGTRTGTYDSAGSQPSYGYSMVFTPGSGGGGGGGSDEPVVVVVC